MVFKRSWGAQHKEGGLNTKKGDLKVLNVFAAICKRCNTAEDPGTADDAAAVAEDAQHAAAKRSAIEEQVKRLGERHGHAIRALQEHAEAAIVEAQAAAKLAAEEEAEAARVEKAKQDHPIYATTASEIGKLGIQSSDTPQRGAHNVEPQGDDTFHWNCCAESNPRSRGKDST